jgi:hypothetical protein
VKKQVNHFTVVRPCCLVLSLAEIPAGASIRAVETCGKDVVIDVQIGREADCAVDRVRYRELHMGQGSGGTVKGDYIDPHCEEGMEAGPAGARGLDMRKVFLLALNLLIRCSLPAVVV